MTDAAYALATAEPHHLSAPRYPQAAFHATITPHNALSPRAERIVISIIAVVATGMSAGFTAFGLWPVAIFIGLDAVFVLAAFLAIRRRMHRREDVIVVPGAVIVQRFASDRFEGEERIEHFGLAVECHLDPDFGCLHLTLKRRDQEIEIARDLSPPERWEFREALLDALWKVGARPRVETTRGMPLAA